MRGTVAGLLSPYPLAESVPAVFREDDDVFLAFAAALDGLLAPIISALDNLPAYFSARHAPEDLLDWLAGWLGLVLDPAWPETRRRELVLRAADLLRLRGTPDGIRDVVALVTGCPVRVRDSGGVRASQTRGEPLPGDPGCWVAVEVLRPEGREIDEEALHALLAAVVPAHVVFHLTVVPE